MNAFHLSCQYYPEAITKILTILDSKKEDYEDIIDDQLKLVVQSENGLAECTPLHIAAQKSRVDDVR
jgi:hypothetical protein